ncbi:SH3 domain-containing protein [Spirochaeta africana]|uniref:SH3 domain-containing protein n=1 Tax=Spirochaeta africana (strain ATCC 700263 / DSM 8902 / Z-7692) TaxID=889378 RepID=H9UIJ0_SPIAZ|nr:SH3 domain-containing protein [Spirochaeta africana]AFG37333.1 hypothetical protein Spiaf_1258 [Spirochaeta africana DSM 8902]
MPIHRGYSHRIMLIVALLTGFTLLQAGCANDRNDRDYSGDPELQSLGERDSHSLIVLSDGLRLRSQPTTTAEVNQLLREGTLLAADARTTVPETVGERTGYWYRVTMHTDDTVSGFVFGVHLDSLPEQTAQILAAGTDWDPPGPQDIEAFAGTSWAPAYGSWGWGVRLFPNGRFNSRYIGDSDRSLYGFWRRVDDTAIELQYAREIDPIARSQGDNFPEPGIWTLQEDTDNVLSHRSLIAPGDTVLHDITNRRPAGQTVVLGDTTVETVAETRNRIMTETELLSPEDMRPKAVLSQGTVVRVLGRATDGENRYAFVHIPRPYDQGGLDTGLVVLQAVGFSAE